MHERIACGPLTFAKATLGCQETRVTLLLRFGKPPPKRIIITTTLKAHYRCQIGPLFDPFFLIAT